MGDGAIADFGVVAGAGDGELIHACGMRAGGLSVGVVGAFCRAGFAVDCEGVAGVEEGHGFGDFRDEMSGVDADDLGGGSGRIGERTDEMEDSADAEGSADGHDGFHCWMERGRVEEGEAVAAESGGAFFG